MPIWCQELASKLDRLQQVLEKKAARKADFPASSEPSAYQQAPASIQNMILQRPKAQPKYPTMIPDLPATTNSFPFRGPESLSSAASGQVRALHPNVHVVGPTFSSGNVDYLPIMCHDGSKRTDWCVTAKKKERIGFRDAIPHYY
jgi:hypothetical protein